MAIVTAEKIFIDVDDEINFVVEKIVAAAKQRVILVVPQNALVISSQVSIKILAKQIVNSKKLVIVVSEDEFGLKLAKQAGITTAKKVSDITGESWEAAQIAIAKQKALFESRKKDLLARRGLIEPETAGMNAEIEVDLEEENSQLTESSAEIDANEVETSVDEDLIADDVHESVDSSEVVEDEEGETIKGPIQRVRPTPKVVKLGNLEVFAGGDVSMIESEPSQDMAPIDRAARINPAQNNKPKGGFAGKDWTKYTQDTKSGGFLSRLFKRQPNRGETKSQSNRRTVAIVGIVMVAVLALLAGGVYALLYRANSVDVIVKIKTQAIPVKQQIKIDAALTASNLADLALDAEVVVVDNLNVSDSAKTTGQGKSGTKASGNIEIWNKTYQEVQILQGTVINNISTAKKYVLKQTVKIEAATKGANGVDTYGGIGKAIAVEAQDIGIDFNIDAGGTAPVAEFTVTGYTDNQLIGKGVQGSIAGGTTETFAAVSQDDVDKLKKGLVDQLKAQGFTQIATAASDGQRVILGTEEFVEGEVKSLPAVGQKADEFTLSVSGKVTALAVKEADLQAAIEQIVLANQDNPEDFEVTGLENAVFADVKRTKDTATFTVTSAGNLRGKLDAEGIKQLIAGKNLKAAQELLTEQSDIESVLIQYSPNFIPENLRLIPSDFGRISVRIQD
jgi:hypothetical protein